MRYLLTTLLSILFLQIEAQDVYHQNLMTQLQNDYGLPTGSWILNDTEMANWDNTIYYGNMSFDVQSTTGQDFSQKAQMVVNAAAEFQWNTATILSNAAVVNANDKFLLVLWMRSQNGPGKVSLFVEDAVTYEKEAYLTLDLGETWRRYLVPMEAMETYPVGDLNTGLHLGWQAQTVEVGGMALINYQNNVAFDDLPNDNGAQFYEGWEADAPWRAEAADRIENLRKADLYVQIVDEADAPISDLEVTVEMLEHEYAFGSAVVACRFPGNDCYNQTYLDKITNLDGEGHGFNWVVFENALKWRAWEYDWLGTPAQKVSATQWLADRDIKIRGHTLVWPGWQYLPDDLEPNQNNANYLKSRVEERLEEILTYPGINENIAEWDVVNEFTVNRDLENSFQGSPSYTTGRELYTEIYDQVQEIAPGTVSYLNDYVTITTGTTSGPTYDRYKQFIQELVDADVKLDGIGFQAHIGGAPNSILEVYNTYEDFYQTFGLTAKVTEYDTDASMSDDLAAQYLRDFLTITFSHESTDGFLMWGFWDGNHWKENAPMYNFNWSLKPAGEAFINLVFDEWWTPTNTLTTNVDGRLNQRGFKGKYKISYECEGEMIETIVDLTEDNTFIISCNGAVNVEELNAELGIDVFPNPVSELLNVKLDSPQRLNLEIYNTLGQKVWQRTMNEEQASFPMNVSSGIYTLILRTEEGQSFYKKLVVE